MNARLIDAGLRRRTIAWLSAVLPALAIAASCHAQSVLSYHGSLDRSGNFIVPALSWERARSLHLDPSFHPRFSGHLYAQPLYWQPPGSASGELIVATESNTVQAIDAHTGQIVWTRALGGPVALSTQDCGNIDPLGITGTPVIDQASQALYLDAMEAAPSGPQHLIFALSLKDGATLPGWPVDVGAALAARGWHFDPPDQNQRGALTILGGRVYVPYGGHFGDCGDYHGWVVGVSLHDPGNIVAWSTRARGGGIWAPGGIASDGRSLFVATGNTFGARRWSDGEAVFRLGPDLRHSASPQDYFAPSDWLALDERDGDLGGTNPLPLNLPGGTGTQALVLALGKDARAYLLDADNLGGIGGSLVSEIVSTDPIRTAASAFPAAGGAFVAFAGPGARCPVPRRDDALTVLKIQAGTPPALTTAWCGALSGAGSPIVTTTDGRANPIVWILGAEGDGRLHGFRGDNGVELFDGGGSGDAMTGLHHFQDLLPADGRLYVGADNRLYAFAF
jgi:outer membrane protein assembly factor BamB